MHEAFWLPHQAPVVGNVAALVPHKGQRYLIDAAHLVVQQMPDARFVILGEGELREHLEKQVHEHHLEKHVLLPGFRTDVLGCIKGFDLFVMSSVTEGLGTSLLDAMACARPIVATRAGGIPEIVEDGVNGAARAAARRRALAAAIVRALKDDGLRRADGRGRLRARRASGSPSSGWSPRPPPCTRAWPRRPPRSGHCESACGAAEAARVHHPEVAEREVVLDRVVRIERAQRRGDVARHPPARAGVARQPQAAADADDVRVERHDRRAGETRDQTPRSSASRRTIQRRNRFSRLHADAGRRPRKEIADAGTRAAPAP